MGRRKRTSLGMIVDHDRYARLKRVQMLFTLRWLEKHRFMRLAVDYYARKFI